MYCSQLLLSVQRSLIPKVCRYAFGKGFPGLTPTFLGSPGAVYNSPAAIGTQQLSHKASAPRAAAVKSTRAAFLRQFVSHDQARVNYGREGPGPAFYEGRRGSGAVGSQVCGEMELLFHLVIAGKIYLHAETCQYKRPRGIMHNKSEHLKLCTHFCTWR